MSSCNRQVPHRGPKSLGAFIEQAQRPIASTTQEATHFPSVVTVVDAQEEALPAGMHGDLPRAADGTRAPLLREERIVLGGGDPEAMFQLRVAAGGSPLLRVLRAILSGVFDTTQALRVQLFRGHCGADPMVALTRIPSLFLDVSLLGHPTLIAMPGGC